MHDVAVGHDVILALDAQLASGLGTLFATELDVVVVANDLGLNKATLKVGVDDAGSLDVLAQAAYKLLGLQSFFTAGEMEVKAWTVRQGATAPQAAGVIHTDFERGFIKAEVIGYDDYIELGGEQGAKAAGKLRIEGKEYIMADGDVVHFRFNV